MLVEVEIEIQCKSVAKHIASTLPYSRLLSERLSSADGVLGVFILPPSCAYNERLYEGAEHASKMPGWHQTETASTCLKGRLEFGTILNNWRNGLRSARCNSVRSEAGHRIRDIKGFVSSKNDRHRSVQNPSVCLKTLSISFKLSWATLCAKVHAHRPWWREFWKHIWQTPVGDAVVFIPTHWVGRG